MQVTILGSGSPMVTADRAGPSTLVRIGKTDLLFDCGRAVLMRGVAVGMTARELAALFVTHMHSDHTTDYNDVITTRWITNTEPRPLTAIGPAGFGKFTDATLAMLENDIHYRMAHHPDLPHRPEVNVTEVSEGLAWEAGGIRVLAAPTDHARCTRRSAFASKPRARWWQSPATPCPAPGSHACARARMSTCRR